ncbi:hypothetical protein CDAR_166341, partial [Caerostris darwini]
QLILTSDHHLYSLTWVRIPSNCVFYYRCPEHNNRYVLSIVFVFDKEEDVYHFAFSYPYSYTRLQKYMESLESKQLPYFKREKIGETLHSKGEFKCNITEANALYTQI